MLTLKSKKERIETSRYDEIMEINNGDTVGSG